METNKTQQKLKTTKIFTYWVANELFKQFHIRPIGSELNRYNPKLTVFIYVNDDSFKAALAAVLKQEKQNE
jgi:hypothetical protein